MQPRSPQSGLRYGDPDFTQLSSSATKLWNHATAPSWSTARNAFGLGRDLANLVRHLTRIPALDVAWTDSPEGQVIRAHLGCRRAGIPRFRLAQGVIRIPKHQEDYARGRARQAMRTNVRRASEAGFRVSRQIVPFSTVPPTPEMKRYRALGEHAYTEQWCVFTAEGTKVAEAWCTVDHEVALLHSMVSRESYARWLLHTELVMSLCGRCDLMLTYSFDAPLLDPGAQHFQRLLGYEIYRLRPRRRRGQLPGRRTERVGNDAVSASSRGIEQQFTAAGAGNCAPGA